MNSLAKKRTSLTSHMYKDHLKNPCNTSPISFLPRLGRSLTREPQGSRNLASAPPYGRIQMSYFLYLFQNRNKNNRQNPRGRAKWLKNFSTRGGERRETRQAERNSQVKAARPSDDAALLPTYRITCIGYLRSLRQETTCLQLSYRIASQSVHRIKGSKPINPP